MRSALYVGSVAHRRRAPDHMFRRRLRLALVFLDEVDSLRSQGLLQKLTFAFRKTDYLTGTSHEIQDEVRDRVEKYAGWRPRGPVALLCQLRHLGLTFDPIRVYYCLTEDEARVEAVIAEVTNTPWGERHEYIGAVDSSTAASPALSWNTTKNFHVSPFMEMARSYRFRVAVPTDQLSLAVQSRSGSSEHFVAAATFRRVTWTHRTMARSLLAFPWMPAQALLGIYFEAARLWWRGAQFHSHPRHADNAAESSELQQ